MAYSYDSRPHESRRHDPYYTSRDTDRYPGVNTRGYSSYEPHYAAYTSNPSPPKRSHGRPHRTEARNNHRWPPSPSVEDEAVALAREVPSEGSVDDESSGEVKSRGSVDQYPILEEIEQHRVAQESSDDRRFVLVSDPSVAPSTSNLAQGGRRKSFAERGNMSHIKTDITETPVEFAKRAPSPYAYTRPSKESTAPSGEYFLSPEPITPSKSSIPRSIPRQGSPWERDQNARPSTTTHGRYDSVQQPPRSSQNQVFEDTDSESDDNTHLRTERTPARYSFVKSDLSKEDLRTSLHDTGRGKERPNSRPSTSHASPRSTRESLGGSSGSSKHSTPPAQSPRSSTSSLNGGASTRQKPLNRPAPVDTTYIKSSRANPPSPLSSRPSSPQSPRERHPSPPRSPKLPTRRPQEHQPVSRPVSRGGGARPPSPSPLSYSSTLPPADSPRVAVTEADWHATYPPATTDRARPSSRHVRQETMPVPPRIDVQSPSPARPAKTGNPLPYPVDDRPIDAFMPPEEAYQFNHAPSPVTQPPRSPYPDSPKMASSPMANSPRERSLPSRPSINNRHTAAEEIPRLARVRSNSVRSQSHDGRKNDRKTTPLSLDRPLPSCPRGEPTDKYNDWYTMENCPNFDICPSCFDQVFADTHFAPFFQQSRRYERPTIRYCDFNSPWIRLAWLLTIKQQRKSPDLLYDLATITETENPCPKDAKTNGPWYGVSDTRDRVHVANFTICQCDYKQIEALFPSLRGCFTRISSSDPRFPKSQTCSLRVSSRRFPKYLDLLVELDEQARLRRRTPDIERFVQLARENAFKRECEKDTASFGNRWHFIPDLPEFTVCEECYSDVVWPKIRDNNRLASSFLRAIQLVPGESTEGTSCCLYSPRMRKAWSRATSDEDFTYLRRKAIDRKKMQERLTRDRAELMRIWESNAGYANFDHERFKRDINDVEDEWKDWE